MNAASVIFGLSPTKQISQQNASGVDFGEVGVCNWCLQGRWWRLGLIMSETFWILSFFWARIVFSTARRRYAVAAVYPSNVYGRYCQS